MRSDTSARASATRTSPALRLVSRLSSPPLLCSSISMASKQGVDGRGKCLGKSLRRGHSLSGVAPAAGRVRKRATAAVATPGGNAVVRSASRAAPFEMSSSRTTDRQGSFGDNLRAWFQKASAETL